MKHILNFESFVNENKSTKDKVDEFGQKIVKFAKRSGLVNTKQRRDEKGHFKSGQKITGIKLKKSKK